jgi:hypothetical protein
MWYGKVIVQGGFSRQGEHQYLQQMKFFTHWFHDLLLLFSMHEPLENIPISQQALMFLLI